MLNIEYLLIFPYLTTETPPSERPQLFLKKLHQCRVLFDFNDASAELKGKQIKAQTLHEMLEYITTQRGVITEGIYPEVVNMVSLDLYNVPTSSSSIPSLPPTYFVPYPLLSTLQVMRSIRRKTNLFLNLLGLIFKSYTNSSSDS